MAGVGVVPRVIKILKSTNNEKLNVLAFRLCGNIAMGDSDKIEVSHYHYHWS